MDNLEKFIKQNRTALDQAEVPKQSWDNIQRRIVDNRRGLINMESRSAKRFDLTKILKIASAVLFLVGFGFLVGKNSVIQQQFQSNTGLSTVSTELAELEKQLIKEVDSKVAQLANYNSDHSVKDDISQLEALMEDLEEELKNSPKASEEQIVNAMIRNYRTRIDILERVLSRIKESKQILNNEADENI